MGDAEKIEFKLFLIGDDNIGRKTIINRFRIMKCTETKENLIRFNSTKNASQIKKINFSENKKSPLRKKGKDYKININKEYFDQEDINTIDNQLRTETTFLKKKIENLTNFTKVFNIAKTYFELNFYNCPTAENLQFSDKINEDDDSERIHKMKFDKLKRYIKNELQKPRKLDMDVKILFLFVFDITNAKTLERIKVYYEELNKVYMFDNVNFSKSKTFYRVLVGNKIDLKVPYEEIDRDILDSLIAQTKVNHYEISGKLNFNFEKFFEKMFFNLFENDFDSFSTDYFKIRLNKLLFTTRTFSKEARQFFKLNDNPAPDNYKNNPYDLNDEKGLT
jgi:GTPase SAR1 family protein